MHPDHFGKLVGYAIEHIDYEAKTAAVGLKIRQDHLSLTGRVHGGVISAFFDFACGAAVFTTLKKDELASTVELKVNYFRPVNLGDQIQALTRVVFRGNRLCVVQGFLQRKGEDAPIGMVTATFNVVSTDKLKFIK